MTNLYKHRLIIDLDPQMGPIQASLELHTLDSRSVHKMTTWTPGPFETVMSVVQELMAMAEERYGIQPELPW